MEQEIKEIKIELVIIDNTLKELIQRLDYLEFAISKIDGKQIVGCFICKKIFHTYDDYKNHNCKCK